jgi:hypothetical protein
MNDVANAPKSPALEVPADYPPTPPRPLKGLDDVSHSLCARLDFSPTKGVHAQLVTVDSDALTADPGEHPTAVGAADLVTVPPDGGSLVAAQAGPGVDTGARYLITDVGVKFPLPSDDVAVALGYAGQVPLAVPTSLLGLLPTGSVLDPNAARAESRGTS